MPDDRFPPEETRGGEGLGNCQNKSFTYQLNNVRLDHITIGNASFTVVTSVRNLGAYFDSNLSMINQMQHANHVFYHLHNTVEYRFLEPSVSRTSRYLEPNLVSLEFASPELYNFTPDFSSPRFLETPDYSNQFRLPWDKLTLHNSNLRKFPSHLERMSITFTPLNKLALPDKLFSCIFKSHNKQATNLSSV